MAAQPPGADAIGPTTQKTPRKGLILRLLSLTAFMVFLDADVVNTALPAIARDFEAPNSVLVWVINRYSLILAGRHWGPAWRYSGPALSARPCRTAPRH